MNFLAHFYLTRGLEEIIVGNFIADFIRSSQQENLSPLVKKGIIIHHSIDRFTDDHPVVRESRKRLRERYKKYSVVITDIYYDHFLAANWNQYSEQPLAQFSSDVYSLLKKHEHILPDHAKYVFQYMSLNNWLLSYADVEGIDKALKGLSQRAKFNSGMEHAAEDLQKHYPEFRNEFDQFFPELINHLNGIVT
ncbi:MAG: acyl carrier protein phosphodiesterase [Bacteroidia bacterium]|nr:acyl carrier protein phosphodiesterase [Bacteroidia bacterium]